MLAERYLKRRFDEGRTEGRTEMQAKWEEWNRRREEALAENRPFDEPPPSMKDK